MYYSYGYIFPAKKFCGGNGNNHGKNKDDRIKVLLNELKELPDDLQKAVTWAIKHWDLVECICKESEMTDEEIEACKTKARERNDSILLILACAAQVFKHQDETDSRTDAPDVLSQ